MYFQFFDLEIYTYQGCQKTQNKLEIDNLDSKNLDFEKLKKKNKKIWNFKQLLNLKY